jgi:hypothetical protein
VATELDRAIDKVRDTRGLSQAEKREIIQQLRQDANANGDLGAGDRRRMNDAINAARGGGGGGNTGGTGDPDPQSPTPEPGLLDNYDGVLVDAPDDIPEGDQYFDATSRSCESVKGSAPEGYRWVGSYDTDIRGNVIDSCRLVPIEEDEPEDTSARDAQRRMARDEFRSVLEGMGFTTAFGFTQQEINQLFSSIDSWLADGWADGYDGGDRLLMKFRTSDETKAIYAKRFGGMAELAARGQAISEAEYIDLERSYRNIMSNYGLPATYYDRFDDYARLIGAGLSPNEVEQRVVAAKQSMNPLVAAELREYYNVTEGDLTAYMLGLTDEAGLGLAAARNQEEIRQRGRLAQIGAAAEQAGFSMNRAQTERLAGTSIGQTIDPFQMQTLSRLESEFNQARRIADRETTLAGIDNETFDQRDALAAAFGDRQKQLASEKRAKRERARFSGSGGVSAGSLSVERNF